MKAIESSNIATDIITHSIELMRTVGSLLSCFPKNKMKETIIEINKDIRNFFESFRSLQSHFNTVCLDELCKDYMDSIAAEDLYESFQASLLESSALNGDNDEEVPVSLLSKLNQTILQPLDQLSLSESFPSYSRKVILASLFVRHLQSIDAKEMVNSKIYEERRWLLMETWKIAIRAGFTLHQQIIQYCQKIDVHERFPDPERSEEAVYDLSQLLMVILTYQFGIGLLNQCVQVWYSFFSSIEESIASSIWSLQSSQGQTLYYETIAIIFLSKSLVVTKYAIDWKEVAFKSSPQELDFRLRNPSLDGSPIYNANCPSHLNIATTPLFLQESAALPCFLTSYLQSESWIDSFQLNYIQPLETLVLRLLDKDTPLGNHKERRDNYELIVTNSHVAIAKHWDATENCIKADVAVSHAILCQLESLALWKRSLSVSSLMLSSTSVVAVFPVVTRLFTDRYEEDSHLLSQWLLLEVMAHVAQSHISIIGNDWLLPKLIPQLPLFGSECARFLCHKVLLSLVLSVLTQHSSSGLASDSSGADLLAALIPSSSKLKSVPYQTQMHQQHIRAIQTAGEYVEQSCMMLQREIDPMILWTRWIPLLKIIKYFPAEIIQYYFVEINNVFLLSCNIWHLPFQAMLLQTLVPLLFDKCRAEMTRCTSMHLTELLRIYLFFRSNRGSQSDSSISVPDLSLSSATQRLHFANNILRDRLWQGIYQQYACEQVEQWCEEMTEQAAHLFQEDDSHIVRDKKFHLQQESSRIILASIEELRTSESL